MPNNLQAQLRETQRQLEQAQAKLNSLYRYARQDLSPAPPVKGIVLKPGAVGYTTYVTATKQGIQALNNPEKNHLTECDIYIIILSQERRNFEVIVRETPYFAKKIISYTQLLSDKGFVTIEFEKQIPNK